MPTFLLRHDFAANFQGSPETTAAARDWFNRLAVAVPGDLAARDPDVLGRFYSLLFGWRFSPDGAEAREISVLTANGDGITGVTSSTRDAASGGPTLIVDVDDVLENVCYAEE